MKKNIFIPIIFSLSLTLAPICIHATSSVYYPSHRSDGSEYHGLLPICNEGTVNETTGDYDNPCGIDALMAMINKLIDFFILKLATPLFVIILIFTGSLYLSSSAKPDNKKKAKGIMGNLIKGFALVLTSWIIVKTILNVLGYKGPMFLI
jgi:hypothetical protein